MQNARHGLQTAMMLTLLETEARRLAFRKNGLCLVVGIANALSMWRTLDLDGAQRTENELAWFVVCVCSALALAIALEARAQQRHIEELIRELREVRRTAGSAHDHGA